MDSSKQAHRAVIQFLSAESVSGTDIGTEQLEGVSRTDSGTELIL